MFFGPFRWNNGVLSGPRRVERRDYRPHRTGELVGEVSQLVDALQLEATKGRLFDCMRLVVAANKRRKNGDRRPLADEEIVAIGELSRLRVAMQYLEQDRGTAELLRQCLLMDSVLPLGSVRDQKGRNTLFEMLIASRLKAAGCMVTRAEPDLICEHAGLTFAVAAKRPRTRETIVKCLKSARDQADRARLPTIAAMDLSEVFTTAYGHRVSQHEAMPRLIDEFVQGLSSIEREIVRALENNPPRIVMIWFFLQPSFFCEACSSVGTTAVTTTIEIVPTSERIVKTIHRDVRSFLNNHSGQLELSDNEADFRG